MSQAGIINLIENNPSIPTQFNANTGFAVPLGNILSVVGNATQGVSTSASGSTLTITVANATTSSNGVAQFNPANFSVSGGIVSLLSPGPFVTSVSGTTNRITSTGGTTPVIDIAATYVGQSSITTLGTVTTGVWNGTAIGPTFGGTGQTSYAAGDVLYASAVNTLSKLTATTNGFVLTLSGGLPVWASTTSGTVTSVSGTTNRITSTGGATPVIDISAAYVGQSSITTLGTITTGVWNATAIGAIYGGTSQTTYAAGDLLYASAINTLSKLTATTNGFVLTLASGLPVWAASTSGTVTSVSGTTNRITSTGGATPVIDISAAYVGQTSITTLGTVTTGIWNATAIGAIYGGTGQTTYATGDILYASGVNTLSKLTATTNTFVLTLVAGVPAWVAPATSGTVTSVSGTANQVAVATGTTTPVISLIGPYTPSTYTLNGVLFGNGTSSIGVTAQGSANTVLLGNGGVPSFGAVPNAALANSSVTLSNGNNITITGSPLSLGGTASFNLTGTTTNAVQLGNASGSLTSLALVNNGVLISGTTGIPSWLVDGTNGQVLTATTGSPPTWTNPATSGTVTSVSGTANQVAVATGTTTPVISLIGPYTPATYTAHGVLVGEGTSSIVAISPSATAGNPLVSAGSSLDPIFSATPTVTSITISNAPVASTDGANKTYVDSAITAVNPATSVVAASTTNLNSTYLNGVSGIGATLTNAGSLAAFTIDGQTPTIGQRVLIKNQTSTFQNGVYTVSTLGTGAIAWILTRALDYDQPSDINNTGVINVLNGTVNALTGWLLNSTVNTVGTDPITYVQYSNAPISVTQYDVLVGGAGNAINSVGPGSAGQYLQSGGNSANPAYSTATLPSTATGTGTLLRADGTNWVPTTSTYPNTNAINTILYASSANVMSALATANNGVHVTNNTGVPSVLAGPGTTGNILQSNSAALPSFSTATYPSSSGGTGKILYDNGTNFVESVPTFPASASATARKIIVSDGTNWVASTETYAVPGTSGNVMTSDGTNWTSAAAGGATIYKASGSLTNTQIKALGTTPIIVIPAQGAGTVIVPVSAVLELIYGGSNAFSATSVQLYLTTSTTGTFNLIMGLGIMTFIQATSNSISWGIIGGPAQSGVGYPPWVSSAASVNIGMAICASGAITGNAANNNTINYSIYYYVASAI